MGLLQDILCVSRSTDIDIVSRTGWVPYDAWDKQINASSVGKSGPCHTRVDKSESERLLKKLEEQKCSGQALR